MAKPMQPFEYPSVSYWSKEINGTLTGGQKQLIFLIRDIDDAATAAAPAESCQFVVLRSPRGRLGSKIDVGNRLRRMRGRFQSKIHLPWSSFALYLFWP